MKNRFPKERMEMKLAFIQCTLLIPGLIESLNPINPSNHNLKVTWVQEEPLLAQLKQGNPIQQRVHLYTA